MKIIGALGNNGLDLNQDGKVTIDELARATTLIFGWIALALSAVVWGMWILVAGKIPMPLTFLRVEAGLVSISLLVAAGIGVYRMLRYERMEGREKTAWELEHERAKWEFDQARGISEETKATSMSQATIDAAVWQMLTYYYHGKDWSREGMEKAGVMTAEVWNEANAMLKKRRIRKGRKRELEPETLQDAWGIYLAAKLRANQFKMDGANDPDWREAS